jgi:diguanylate cyclase (GGDEF)-like protein
VASDTWQLHRRLSQSQEQLRAINERLEAIAAQDALTGVANRRMIEAQLDHALALAHRHGVPFALLFIDIDHFKEFNDRYGHLVGDAVLHEVAITVRATLRSSDLVGRWGGEEFIAILPYTGPEEASRIAERLRRSIQAREFAVTGCTHISCSIGVAACPEDGRSRDDLIRLADHAMYVAKRSGRNCVVSWSAGPVVAAQPNSPENQAMYHYADEAWSIGTLQ